MQLIRNQLALSLSVAAGITLPQAPALASSYHSTTTVHGAAELHDDQFDGHVVWISFESADGSTLTATGVMLNEQYGLTTGHVFSAAGQVSSNHTVGIGDNFVSTPGTVHLVVDSGTHPSWTGNFVNGSVLSELDLAWFKLDQPIPGAGVTLGVAGIGDICVVPEFGQPATAGGGVLAVDGERRAFDAPIDRLGLPNAFGDDYFVAEFLPLVFRNLPMAAIGTDGTSGSPWFNEFGEVVGITAGGVGSPNYFGSTAAVNLAPHHGWIIANTQSVLDCPGDADGSRVVDMRDFAIVQQTFGQLGAMFSDGDFDHDDDIDFDDAMILFDEMGMECP